MLTKSEKLVKDTLILAKQNKEILWSHKLEPLFMGKFRTDAMFDFLVILNNGDTLLLEVKEVKSHYFNFHLIKDKQMEFVVNLFNSEHKPYLKTKLLFLLKLEKKKENSVFLIKPRFIYSLYSNGCKGFNINVLQNNSDVLELKSKEGGNPIAMNYGLTSKNNLTFGFVDFIKQITGFIEGVV